MSQKLVTPADYKNGVQRPLAVVVSEDMPDLHRELVRAMQTVHPSATEAANRIQTNYAVHGQVSWTIGAAGEPFGFSVQLLSDNQLIRPDMHVAPPGLEDPILFLDGYNIMYLIEGGPGAPPNPPLVEGATPRWAMCIASGESKLFDEMRRLVRASGFAEDTVRMMPLRSGDVTWVDGSGTQVGFVVERKRNDDFVSTIKGSGGRGMQLAVMLDTAPHPSNILYLIEGDVLAPRSGVVDSARLGSLVYPIFRHGVRVANTQSTIASAAFLFNLWMQMERCDTHKLKAHGMVFGNKLNETPKKAHYTGDGGRDEFIRLLTVVERVSDQVAIAIAQRYPTFGDMMKAFFAEPNPKKRELVLQDIQVTVKSGNVKRVGPALSRAIARKFCVAQLAPASHPDTDDDDSDSDGDDALQEESDDEDVKKHKPSIINLVDEESDASDERRKKFKFSAPDAPSKIKKPTKKRAAPIFDKKTWK